jgi:large subunit ribosomal protein L24
VRGIKRNDTVVVISGKERGRQGEVRRVFPLENKVVVPGLNMIKRHQRPRSLQQPGGIIEREAPLQISNVMLICKNCSRPTRVGFQKRQDGTKIRVCKRCGQDID